MKVEKRKKARPWVGMGARSGRGVLLRLMLYGIRSNQQTSEVQEEMVRDLLEAAWETAIAEAQAGDRVLLDSLLDLDEPLPAEVDQELLTLKRPRKRPLAWSPEDVVEAVQYAIETGHPYSGNDDNEEIPAFVEAARLLGYNSGTVVNKWKQVPRELRREIRDEIARLLRLEIPLEEREELGRLKEDSPGGV